MSNFKNLTTLDLAESYAEQNDMLSSEEFVSEQFDVKIAPRVIEKFGAGDKIAMEQAFADWTDLLCKDGDIHVSQYVNYAYVGRYSDDEE